MKYGLEVQLNFLRIMIEEFKKYLSDISDLHWSFDLNDLPKPCSLDSNVSGGLYWLNDISKLHKVPMKSNVVLSKDILNYSFSTIRYNHNYILSDNPRLTFAKIIDKFYSNLYTLSKPKLVFDDNLGNNVLIGENVNTGNNVVIGNNVIIHDNVTIGDNVKISDNVTIGSIGLGFERLEDGTLYKFKQLGGVVIGSNVEIGTYTDIKRGTLGNTIISDGCKIGSYNNIGHNVVVGENCLITVGCILCGSSRLGDNVTMGTKSTVKEKIKIPKNSTVGGLSFVNKNFINENIKIIGIPGRIKNEYE